MAVLSVRSLSKSFGGRLVVDDLTFDVERGTVTGFVGPNGSGKTTTLRMMLGLVRPDAGEALINDRAYRDLDNPAATVGAVLEATNFHPGRTARAHLGIVARGTGAPLGRVAAVLGEVGLSDAADRAVRGFSLGMRQRLGLATALLTDPAVLLLDEPTNGLDPEGVHWLRALVRRRADAGATVLVSSHLLAELALSADRIVVLKQGRLVAHETLAEITGRLAAGVHVRTPDVDTLLAALLRHGIAATKTGADELVASNASGEAIGAVIAETGAVVYELRRTGPDLEEAFLSLTGSDEGMQ
jgi:ABC-2 type transport system ATP-binding protein